MPQLILNIIKNDERIANICFDNRLLITASDAFNESLRLYNQLILNHTNFKSNDVTYLRQQLLQAVQSQGGGLDGIHFDTKQDLNIYPELNNIYNEHLSPNRNSGLIAFSDESMAYADDCGQSSASFNLDTLTVNLCGIIDIYNLTDPNDFIKIRIDIEALYEEEFEQGKTLIDIINSLPTYAINIEAIPINQKLNLPNVFKQGNTIYSTIG